MPSIVFTILRRLLHHIQHFFGDIVAAFDFGLLPFPSSRFLDDDRVKKCSKTSSSQSRPTISLHDLADQVHLLFLSNLTPDRMLLMSRKIQAQLASALQSSTACMLPSYTHMLPTGSEQGVYLALDVGGSTFRVALVHLRGRGQPIDVLRMSSCPITSSVSSLEGQLFFDWMASCIQDMLRDVGDDCARNPSEPLPVGLSWSFPVDQTSVSSGRISPMGKGFRCSNGIVGQDLSHTIEQSCRKRNICIRIDALVNDSSATLLSQSYINPQTRMSLILGTGANVALHLPVDGIAMSKFGSRPQSWFDRARHVIVNSELSMFGGGGILPITRWDDHLNRTHLRPNFQPLEYLTAGQYLGEIVRLILVEAVEMAHLLGGEVPHSLRQPYSLSTDIIAFIEADASSSLASSAALLQKEHTFVNSPSVDDLLFIQCICRTVSHRAAAYLAIAIHSIRCQHNDIEASTTLSPVTTVKEESSVTVVEHESEGEGENESENKNQTSETDILSIACEGSVINKYPGFKDRCQTYLDQLMNPDSSVVIESDESTTTTTTTTTTTGARICLQSAHESAILGAAVAVAVAVGDS